MLPPKITTKPRIPRHRGTQAGVKQQSKTPKPRNGGRLKMVGGWRESGRLRGLNRWAAWTGQVMGSRRLLGRVGEREERANCVEKTRKRGEQAMSLNGIRERRLEIVRRRRQSSTSAKRRTAVAHPSDPTVSGPFEQFAETFAGTHDAAEPSIELIDRLHPVIRIDALRGQVLNEPRRDRSGCLRRDRCLFRHPLDNLSVLREWHG